MCVSVRLRYVCVCVCVVLDQAENEVAYELDGDDQLHLLLRGLPRVYYSGTELLLESCAVRDWVLFTEVITRFTCTACCKAMMIAA